MGIVKLRVGGRKDTLCILAVQEGIPRGFEETTSNAMDFACAANIGNIDFVGSNSYHGACSLY